MTPLAADSRSTTENDKPTVYRGAAALIGCALATLFCGIGAADLIIESGTKNLTGASILLLVAVLSGIYGVYPAAFAWSDRLVVRNPFRTIELPWPAVTELSARLSFVAHTERSRFTIWAIPVSLRERRKADAFGRPFKIYKFRSMIVDAERNTGPVWASAQDARVTRLGKFLRRARLDEIPQLWNVMLGDMSLVGPRPERPTFVESLSVSIPDYPKRCSALPGITGLAQVKSRYDTSVDSANRKLQYDLYYLKNGRILLDLKIMAATVKVMARGEGAH